MATKMLDQHIEITPGIAGGKPRIAGRRITVQNIAIWHERMGKGADEIALRIRQIAAEFGIPIVERKPLARALYDAVEVGQYIPESFYRAIAEILAYIYELTGRSKAAARGERPGGR